MNNRQMVNSQHELVDRIMSEITHPDILATIKDRLSYSNVFSISVLQIHPLCHAGLAINETAAINARLSELLGLKTFYQYGDVFCRCHDPTDIVENGLFHDIRTRDRLPHPPTYTQADVDADINAVVSIYNMYKKTLDSELTSRRRIRIHAAKNAVRNYSVMQLFTSGNQNKNKNNEDDDPFNAPLRINKLNYDPFIREKQWETRVAKEIARRIGVPWIEIQGAHVSLGDVILTSD
jgi:hypothetical protein